MSKGFASNYRIVLLGSALLLSFAGLGTRLVWLHVVDRDELLRYVNQARQQITPEHARRGDIVDRNGNILATSRSLMVLGVDPRALRKEDEAKWPKLAALINIPLADLQKLFTTRYRAAAPLAVPANPRAVATESGIANAATDAAKSTEGWAFEFHPAETASTKLKDDNEDSSDEDTDLEDADAAGKREIRWAKLSDNISETLYTQVEKLGIKGVYGTRIYRRAYPHGQLAAHVIGFVDNRQHPATGIERYEDFYLRGQDGWRESEKDGKQHELAQFRSREVPRADGYSVKLSLDCTVQDIVEQELAYIAEKFQPKKATIIVTDPRTGFILAMGNYPTFDLNAFNKVPKSEEASLKNIAVTDIVEPGSTFKIVSVSAGLEEGIITPEDKFNCMLEKVEYLGKVLRLPAEDHHFDHDLTVAEIVSRSSNRGAAQIGMKLGKERVYEYARKFGFGHTLGFPTGGEVSGILARPEKWNELDITRIPMGHTVAATPLQMIQAMSTIANKGMLLRPQIVKEVNDSNGEGFRYAPAEIGRAVSENTAKIMAQLLAGVAMKGGTGETAAIEGFEVAGKTGTTEKLLPVTKPNGRTELEYSHKHHIASFVGFFPASVPQVAIAVIVDDADEHAPGGYASGHVVAAPSFKHIGEQLIPYLNITPVNPNPSPTVFAMTGGHR